jgi:hypothetical protein
LFYNDFWRLQVSGYTLAYTRMVDGMGHQQFNNRGDPIPPSKLRRMSRAAAELALEKLICRAEAINADKPWPYYFAKLAVFGSFLAGKPDLGDLDVGYEIGRRTNWSTEYTLRLAEHTRTRSYLSQLHWCERQTLVRLKAKNAYISLHRFDEVEQLRTEYRLIFEARAGDQRA